VRTETTGEDSWLVRMVLIYHGNKEEEKRCPCWRPVPVA